MKEEWKPIEGYNGLYEVSNMGNVKSLNYKHTGKEGILKGNKDKDGYLYVKLWKEGKMKRCTIHRLVALAFIPNPDNLPVINHRDENKQNNIVSNLEWCTYSYNNIYNDRAKKVGEKLRGRKLSEEHIKKLSKSILGIDKVTGLIVEFTSAKEAERQTGINQSNITQCCKGKYKSMGGFYWYYADTEQ